ncbi:hypothetical protein ACF0H5_007033 [Mactra antiquata]
MNIICVNTTLNPINLSCLYSSMMVAVVLIGAFISIVPQCTLIKDLLSQCLVIALLIVSVFLPYPGQSVSVLPCTQVKVSMFYPVPRSKFQCFTLYPGQSFNVLPCTQVKVSMFYPVPRSKFQCFTLYLGQSVNVLPCTQVKVSMFYPVPRSKCQCFAPYPDHNSIFYSVPRPECQCFTLYPDQSVSVFSQYPDCCGTKTFVLVSLNSQMSAKKQWKNI